MACILLRLRAAETAIHEHASEKWICPCVAWGSSGSNSGSGSGSVSMHKDTNSTNSHELQWFVSNSWLRSHQFATISVISVSSHHFRSRVSDTPPSHAARLLFLLFFFNATATTEIYTLSLHDALPI